MERTIETRVIDYIKKNVLYTVYVMEDRHIVDVEIDDKEIGFKSITWGEEAVSKYRMDSDEICYTDMKTHKTYDNEYEMIEDVKKIFVV